MLLVHGTVMICIAVGCERALPGAKSFASKLQALQDRTAPQGLVHFDLTVLRIWAKTQRTRGYAGYPPLYALGECPSRPPCYTLPHARLVIFHIRACRQRPLAKEKWTAAQGANSAT